MIIIYDKTEYDISEKYSRKDFTGWSMADSFPDDDMNELVIEGSCFSHEVPDSVVFPTNMKGTTFIDCNLDNCFIPENNTILGRQPKKFKVQNDLNDWIVNDQLNPIKPTTYALFEKFDLPMPLPQDIPTQKVATPLDLIAIAKTK